MIEPRRIRAASPDVIAAAEQRNVTLDDLTRIAAAKGGGAITMDDVSNEYLRREVAVRIGLPADASVKEVLAGATVVAHMKNQWVAAAAAARQKVQQIAAATPVEQIEDDFRPPAGPDYALNPLVDAVYAKGSRGVAAAAGAGVAEPQLFVASALPSFTASGIPVEELLEVPWQARHALARAATTAEAYAIKARLADAEEPGSQMTAADIADMEFGGDEAVTSYRQRVRQWEVDNMTEAELDEAVGILPVVAQAQAELDARNEAFRSRGEQL